MSRFLDKRERRIVQKPWGWIDWIYNGTYCGKIVYIKKGSNCSWHYHITADEVIYVESGKAELIYGEDDDPSEAEIKILKVGEAFHITTYTRHQLYAIEDLHLYEFSIKQEESDIIRITQNNVIKNCNKKT